MKKSKALLLILSFLVAQGLFADFTWIESESIAKQVPNATTGWAKPELLSEGQVFSLSFRKKDVEEKIPEDGLVISYPFSVSSTGKHTLWNRMIFEKVRASFEWRVDGGSWTENSQEEQPLSNMQELAFWNPIGWTKMGAASLSAGEHQLEIRLTRRYEDPETKKKLKDSHYCSDVLLITTDDFRPNYRFKPGQEYQTDIDRAAAAQVFTLSSTDAPRQELDLTGLWEFAPYDEIDDFSEEARVTGVAEYPAVDTLNWYGYSVPGDRNPQFPEMRFAHRFVVRSAVEVPSALKGDSFQLTFESISMISTLFINQQKVEDFVMVKGRWQVDVSDFISAGKKNEILLVIKDSYYSIKADDNDPLMNARRKQYIPESMFNGSQGTTMLFDFPAANGHGQSGLLDIVKLEVSKGPAYVQDTFVKPFPITRKEIEIDTTVYNPSKKALDGSMKQLIRSWPDGKTVATLSEQSFLVRGGESETVRATTSSEPLTLWWTYDATLYELVTDVVVDGKVIDRSITRFGNREWEVRGVHFYLNGVQQHLRSDTTYHWVYDDYEAAVPAFECWKKMGVNMIRRRFQEQWFGRTPRELINLMDELGMSVRQACATFDGQVCSYKMVDNPNRTLRKGLFERWRAQCLNGVKARRNNPSVFIWELDNELIYINARNFGLSKKVEPEFTKTSNQIMAMDPTRVTVCGGGAALLDESLPVYGVHYYEVDLRHYPNEAYVGVKSLELEGSGEKGRIWPVDFDKKPIFFSETAFLPGFHPSSFAAVGGEITFLGKRQSRPAAGKIALWLGEGYRWKGYAGGHFWLDNDFTDGSYTDAWQPITILRRHWKDTYGPGEKVQRELRVYNDLPNTAPITAAWAVELNGKTVLNGSKEFTVAPGTFEPWNVTFTMPQTETRQAGFFHLTTTRDGKTLAARAIPIELVPESKPVPAKINGPLVVWDPEGSILKRLKATGYTVDEVIDSMDQIPMQFGLLVVGKNALSASDATSRDWLTMTASGKRIVFFEQNHPIHFQAVPADYEPTDFDGTIAFSQNLSHPIFEGIEQNDLDFWGRDEVVYRHALRKPSKGAVSLIQVDDALAYSAMVTINVDEGLNVVSQMAIAEKLDEQVSARRLFDNIIRYAATYQRIVRSTTFTISEPFLAKSIGTLGVDSQNLSDPVAALKGNLGGVLVVEGTKANLAALAGQPKLLQKSFEAGGWVVVLNVTPDSLPAFNQLVGFNHVIREFRQERVRFPAVRDPLTSGLSQRDVVMSSGRRIQAYTRDEWPTDDAFDYVVDLKDVAPFAEFPSPAYWNDPQTTGPGNDTWPLNMVNGYGRDTHWRMVFSIHLMRDDPTNWTLKLPQAEKIKEIRFAPNGIYHRIKAYEITVNGDASTMQAFEVDPQDELQVLTFETPVLATDIEINITDWLECGSSDVIGIDNMEIIVERPADFDTQVRGMLNIGGLVDYPRAKGGIILSQYVFREHESNPINYEKKKTVLAALMRNLGSPFGGKATPIAGFNLRYSLVSLEGAANLYLTKDQGWPTSIGDLSALPRGNNSFSGVRYLVRDFSTSPLESAVTLQHPKFKSNATEPSIKGMSVDETCDSLFFLHTFVETRKAWEFGRYHPEPPVLFVYTIHYKDGSQEKIDVTFGREAAHWLQAEPSALSNAGIAWMGPIEGSEKKAVVYQLQWNNPHPGKEIQSIDLGYGKDGNKWGTPVLLGITAASVQE